MTHRKIYLYDESSSETLDLSEIARYLEAKLKNVHVNLRPEFINFHSGCTDDSAKRLVDARVRDLNNPDLIYEPMHGEIEYEKRMLKDPGKSSIGILYDGLKVQELYEGLVPVNECNLKNIHIIFTNRLIGTWDDGDLRYHARVIVCGHPCMISTSGIVEAPAMPTEFYHLKQQYAMSGMPLDVLKEEFKGRFIDHDDPRLTEAMKGYVMQAIFYQLTLEPFCNEKSCRLYNAHFQEEVFHAQFGATEFCEKHEKMLGGI